MGDHHELVCYLKSGTCSLRSIVSCVLIAFFPFKFPL